MWFVGISFYSIDCLLALHTLFSFSEGTNMTSMNECVKNECSINAKWSILKSLNLTFSLECTEGISTVFCEESQTKRNKYYLFWCICWSIKFCYWKMGNRILWIRRWQVFKSMDNESMVSIHRDTPVRRNNLWCGIAPSISCGLEKFIIYLKIVYSKEYTSSTKRL